MIKKPKFWDDKIGVLSIILIPISLVISIIIFIKKNITKPKSYNLPVICIGNIYLGGTGKTPTAMFLAKELEIIGKKSVIIRKYYKDHDDEYDLIKRNKINLIVNQERAKSVIEAKKKMFDGVLLDDGLQDYKIKKNLSIVCFNQNQKVGNGLIIPAGPLRESLRSLKKMDVVIINGKKEDVEFEKKILSINKKLEIFYSHYEPENLDKFRDFNLLAMAGIGNPENFFKILEENNLNLKKKIKFPDHYKFAKKEIENILEFANQKNYKIIMTEKDYVKIKKFKLPNIDYLKVSLKIEKKEKLINRIKEIYD